ncbi:hypothetical protein M8C21_028091 [Ambrosia artemisiifolia]|uniref:Uncharacterized protein n=1 Tax=Ambrosia artemisiifolia TaxID=4212 RepID=A0AAD5D159_AMBAR|nr:hypothetical protein M8C21_028091 [Ambrosia artemisiifolia]
MSAAEFAKGLLDFEGQLTIPKGQRSSGRRGGVPRQQKQHNHFLLCRDRNAMLLHDTVGISQPIPILVN